MSTMEKVCQRAEGHDGLHGDNANGPLVLYPLCFCGQLYAAPAAGVQAGEKP